MPIYYQLYDPLHESFTVVNAVHFAFVGAGVFPWLELQNHNIVVFRKGHGRVEVGL